jgi:hypothetical protein
VGGVTTVYIAGLYEYSGGAAKSYYTGPGGVVAMRSGGTVYYLLSDQLNSTARIVNSAGAIQDTNYFYPGVYPEPVEGAATGEGTARRFNELLVCHTVREGAKRQLVDISVCRGCAKNYVCLRGVALSCSDRATHRVDVGSSGVSARATENELKQRPVN